MKPELKKLLILNAPYLLFVYLFDKIGQAVRLAPGADLSGKVLCFSCCFNGLPESLKIKFFFVLLHSHFTQLHCIFHLPFEI